MAAFQHVCQCLAATAAVGKSRGRSKNTQQAQKLMLLALKATAICFPYSLAASGAPCGEDGDLAGFRNPVELLLSLPASPAASLHTLRPIILRLLIAAAVPTQPYGHFNH